MIPASAQGSAPLRISDYVAFGVPTGNSGRGNDMLLRTDAERLVGAPVSRTKMLRLMLSDPGFLAVTLFRFQSWVLGKGFTAAAQLIKMLNVVLTGAELTPGCQIGPSLIIRHPSGIVIGVGAVIGANCTLLHQVTLGEIAGDGSDPEHRYPVVGDNVVISAGAKLIGRIHVGDNTVIGANAVVLQDVPPNCVAVGVPARVLSRNQRHESVVNIR